NAFGGGLLNATGSTLVLSRSAFTHNEAHGGTGATGVSGMVFVGNGTGGGLANFEAATVMDTRVDDNQAVGGDGNTVGDFVGTGGGGGIATGSQARTSFTASNITLTGNQAVGSAGNTAGSLAGVGIGGGLVNFIGATVRVSGSLFRDNQAL